MGNEQAHNPEPKWVGIPISPSEQNISMCALLSAWDELWQQTKLTRLEPDPNPNAHLLCNAWTGLLLTYRDIWARLRESDIGERNIGERDNGERDIGERDIGERDIGETVATCRFAE